jgi:hypothetical protein
MQSCHGKLSKTRISISGLQEPSWKCACNVQTVRLTTKVYEENVQIGYAPSIDDDITVDMRTDQTRHLHSAIMPTIKTGCNFKTVNNTTEVSIVHYRVR